MRRRGVELDAQQQAKLRKEEGLQLELQRFEAMLGGDDLSPEPEIADADDETTQPSMPSAQTGEKADADDDQGACKSRLEQRRAAKRQRHKEKLEQKLKKQRPTS